MHTIAIIGAGFSGSLTSIHLLRQAVGAHEAGRGFGPLKVVMFERTGVFGPGLAYGHGSDSLLLNVVAGRMSALPDEPDDFLRWARREDPTVRGETFLPRRWYGRYLAGLVEQYCRSASGAEVEVVRVADEVVGVQAGASGLVLKGRRGARLEADQVVLAFGNAAPATPSWCNVGLEASGRYLADPWRQGLGGAGPKSGLEQIGKDENVLVVGAGLTMMDVAISLRDAGHRGTIDVVSRRGLIPQAHRHGNASLAKLPDPLVSRTYSNVRELLHDVRAHARHAEALGGDWRDAVNAMRSITPRLWGGLNERERRRFLEHLLPFWNTHRHRAPQSIAEGIEEMQNAGRLRVHAARITGADAIGNDITVRLNRRGGAAGASELRVGWIINCMGPSLDARRTGIEVVDQMLEDGVVRPGPLGLGLDFDEAGHVLAADGAAQSRVWLMGPARVGKLWETTAVPELRVQAADVATRILNVLRVTHVGVNGGVTKGMVAPPRA